MMLQPNIFSEIKYFFFKISCFFATFRFWVDVDPVVGYARVNQDTGSFFEKFPLFLLDNATEKKKFGLFNRDSPNSLARANFTAMHLKRTRREHSDACKHSRSKRALFVRCFLIVCSMETRLMSYAD